MVTGDSAATGDGDVVLIARQAHAPVQFNGSAYVRRIAMVSSSTGNSVRRDHLNW